MGDQLLMKITRELMSFLLVKMSSHISSRQLKE